MKNNRTVKIIIIVIFLVMNLYFHLEDTIVLHDLYGTFSTSYAIDIILPCYLYLLSTLSMVNFEKWKQSLVSRIISAVTIFVFCSLIEILQYYDINIFGNTYDPVDFLMYFSGILLGFSIDMLISNKPDKKR